ncbi:MAG: LLM class F420-dependent oxidoreductase [Candidatus Acidoferrales bacterium]
MRIGICLPQLGALAGAENCVKAAQRAEALGYDSLWVLDRLLYPVKPQTPYPVTPDGSLPEPYQRVLDPIGLLMFAATHTQRVALGTSVLDMPFYNPVVLARQLTTLDVLSGGRLRLGLGQGWSQDEFDATGADAKRRGPRADEFLQVLKAIWTTDPVEFQGKFFRVPKSIIQPKPVQKPHPPIIIAAFAERALKRVARFADGWNPTGIPLKSLPPMIQNLRAMAKKEGRDPSALKIYVRGNLVLSQKPRGKDGADFTGTLDDIKEDVARCQALGAEELFFDLNFSPDGQSLDRYLALMEKLSRFK